VRVTTGCRISGFYGNYYIRGNDLLALPNCNADWTVGLEITHDSKTLQSSTICVQSALLFTNSRGERRIRVNTIALPVTDSEQDIFKSVNVKALSNLMMKSSTHTALQSGLPSGRQKLIRQCKRLFSLSLFHYTSNLFFLLY
jgi:protein transport protein SEC24